MRRAGKRRRIARGIYKDKSGISVVVPRDGEHRFPLGTPLDVLKTFRNKRLLERAATAPPVAARGTLQADVTRYCALARHLVGWDSRRAELRAWIAALGPRRSRYSVRREDVLRVRAEWMTSGVAPKTCNNRLTALRALYTALDGPDAACPADKIRPLPVPRTPRIAVDADLIGQVYRNLLEAERRGYLRDAKTRARFRFRAATGRRPAEIMRIAPADFDLTRGIWHVRDAKGGLTPGGVFLTGDIRAAVDEFISADAFGEFNTGSFARVLRHAGWPEGVRPYALRGTLGIALADAGADHLDIAAVLGHRDANTTREHYVGIRESRTRAALERLDGRVNWQIPVETARGNKP
jgi:integrase